MKQKMKRNDQGGPKPETLDIKGNPEFAQAAKDAKDLSKRLQAATQKRKGHYEYSCCGTRIWVRD